MARHYGSLESLASFICRDAVSEIGEGIMGYRESMIICTGGLARRSMSPALDSNPQFRPALEPYRSGA